MDSPESPVVIYFFPFVGGGHQIPMIDMARVFASHGAKSTILSTTPANALRFQNSIRRDQRLNRPINIHVLHLPDDGAASPDSSMSAGPFTDTSALREPLNRFLAQNPPDCVVVDVFHRWAADVIDGHFIKRVVFNGNGCFARCVSECIGRFAPHQHLGSDSEPFLVPRIPDRIELTRSQLPPFARKTPIYDRMAKAEEKSFGVIVNSFTELEPKYVDFFKNELGKKAWTVGPVSLCNRDNADKTERGQSTAIDDQRLQDCLDWLESEPPNSVVYVSFGSLGQLSPLQLIEIAHGLEASGHNFIWVVGKILGCGGDGEDWLPAAFGERMAETKKGIVIRGWAPQILMLEHRAVGGFVSHCGWNSTVESVTAGVPVVAWPLSAEQFYNEKLVTDVLGIGVQVGNREWGSWDAERQELVGREKVAAAVKRVMGGGEEAVEMRKRAAALKEKARRAVEQGGSSFAEVDALISELKSLRKN